MAELNLRLILGGTFDPIHLAHIQIALDCAQLIKADQLHFIPCYQPVHRDTPGASSLQRVAMLELATANIDNAMVDLRELERKGPSYMLDTLASLRREFPNDSLCLLMGADSWYQFDTWHRWQEFSEFAHIVIAERPGYQQALPKSLATWSQDKQIQDPQQLKRSACGKILRQRVSYLAISATQVRQAVQQGVDLTPFVPDSVANYIQQQAIYRDRGEL